METATRSLEPKSAERKCSPGRRKIAVEVVDMFGNDAMTILGVGCVNSWDFPGAKWWKFDFHTHTPASDDFLRGCSQDEKNTVTPEFWLRKFMEKGVDCVAITDHNSGEWIDKLKEKLEQICTDNPEWYRPLWLFPGVEISVHGGFHVLAIFDPVIKPQAVILITCLEQLLIKEPKGKVTV